MINANLNVAGIIPARYASVRFPGKPLAIIRGKPMIQRVYDQAVKCLDHVYVATDDDRIYKAVESFGGKAIHTSVHHKSGTERCSEAISIIEQKENTGFHVIINIQGDEPFIQPSQIQKVVDCFSEPDVQIATLIKNISDNRELHDPNKVKVVADKKMYAIYFSRAVIPYYRNIEKQDDWISHHPYYLHIGIYGYRRDILPVLADLGPAELETAESLEQLRWIENGFRIKLDITDSDSIGIDTPADLKRFSGSGLL